MNFAQPLLRLLVLWFTCRETELLPLKRDDSKGSISETSTYIYLKELYSCLSRSGPLECYGVEANVVRSVNGNVTVVQQPVDAVLLAFNISSLASLSRNDSVLAAEIRVYKSPVDSATLSKSECNSSSVTLLLSSSSFLGYGGSAISVHSRVTLSRDDLTRGKWIAFRNLTELYAQWLMGGRREAKLLSLSTAGAGSCSPSALGFLGCSLSRCEPMMVIFLVSPPSLVALGLLPVGPRPQQQQKRALTRTCSLVEASVDLSNTNIIYPASIPLNVCKGPCPPPRGSDLSIYPTDHAKYLYYAHEMRGDVYPSPCCVPLTYRAMSVTMMEPDGVLAIKTLASVIADSCHCR